MDKNIIIENKFIRLEIAGDCTAKSLVYKPSGEELLQVDEKLPLFRTEQARPYNNEVKLAHMNKYTAYDANSIREENGRYIIGFEAVPYEVAMRIEAKDTYITFTLEELLAHANSYKGLTMDGPPTLAFRLVQLPFKHRKNFGEWLNIVSDEEISACVVATSPYELADSEKTGRYRTLYAKAIKEAKLLNTTAALIVCPTPEFMDIMAGFEEDFDLPRGVASRRDPMIRESILRVPFIDPSNVDTYIDFAKKGGFKLMLIYYIAMYEEKPGYYLIGNYDYRPSYPNKDADLKAMLDKIKAAGITPGLHVLHTHIGIESRYVTPVPDHRLQLKKYFTLAKPVKADDDVIYVEENPKDVTTKELMSILRFGKELIHYESRTTEPPYCFKGCKRGYWNTTACDHEDGTIGGLLDVSEYGATSIYLAQDSSLQDEIAEKIANTYNQGFEFVYFDGSEGAKPPFEFHVSNAQMKVYGRMHKKPLFCEGAAKTHFGWHLVSGGNAFDDFSDDIYKAMIIKYPCVEAEEIQPDHTRVNFGWWFYRTTTQPDMYEFGVSRAAAWNCPTTVSIGATDIIRDNPRNADVLEVLRRWADVRRTGKLTQVHMDMLKDTAQEHTLLIDESGEYELVPYWQIPCGAEGVRAFFFERKGKSYVTFWHESGEGKMKLHLPAEAVWQQDIGKETKSLPAGSTVLEVGNKCYLSAAVSKEELCKAFAEATAI